ncbi:MAG TPA: serine/threonine-protein kinase [Asanoa sp.]|nr:serine/threonine-protein kinase [Asanoa sp.]
MADGIVGDRYRLDEVLGRGGTATVWRGVDLLTGEPVAVKVLAAAHAARPVALERLRREALAVSRLAHPNIVDCRALGADFLTMELVEGQTVADLIATAGALPVAQVISLGEQVCAALAAAHAAGVVHRDIKPENLIVTAAGVVKVCDFGIAQLRIRDGQAALTDEDEAVGTAEYMAPEQLNGDPIDARTDLYALGCVLYAMLAGRPPFLGETAMAVFYQHLNRPPAPLGAIRADVPPELDELVQRLLAKHRTDRPETATAVRTRLADVPVAPQSGATAGGGEVTAVVPRPTATIVRSAGPLPRGRRRRPTMPVWRWSTYGPLLRRPWMVVAAAVAVLGITVAVVATSVSSDPVRTPAWPPAALAPNERPAASPDAEATPDTPTPSRPVQATTPSRTSPPLNGLAGFAAAVQQQIDSGNLVADAGRDLLYTLGEIATAEQRGQPGKGNGKLRAVDKRLAELRRDGKLSSAGFAKLSGLIDNLRQA